MASSRRIGAATSKTRAVLLDVTAEIMLEEGYAAVTSRRVAAKAGVNAALVHYYFPTLDDLFVAAYRRRGERLIQSLTDRLGAEQPLRALWEYNSDWTGTSLAAEFLALANHRKAIQAEVAEVAQRLRKLQIEALSDVLERYGIDGEVFPPAAVVVLMVGISQVIVIEEALGLTTGHPEALTLVERFLEQLEGPKARPANRVPRTKRKPTR